MTYFPLSCAHTLAVPYKSSTCSHRSLASSSNRDTSPIRSITLFPLSPSSTLKTSYISKSSTKGIVSSNSICCYPFLIPPSIASMCCTALVTLILSISKVIPSYSCYIKKGLVYIIIAALFGR